ATIDSLTNRALSAFVVATSRGSGSPGVSPLVGVLGLSLVEHALRTVEGAFPARIAVLAGDVDAVRAALGAHAVALVRAAAGREVPEAGALRELLDTASTLVVVAADRPLLRAETLRALVTAHDESGAAATVMGPGIGAFAAAALRPLLEDSA